MKTYINNTLKVLIPVCLGILILYWTYCDFDFSRISSYLHGNISWEWMALSLSFGIVAQVIRGLRWVQTLEPLGEHARRATSVYSIFISYGANMILPRVGEISRCGILKKYDGVSFSKSIGTVVMERAIDTLCILIITLVALLLQMSAFTRFFAQTGTSIDSTINNLPRAEYWVVGCIALIVLGTLFLLLRKTSLVSKIHSIVKHIIEGLLSLRGVRNKWLFTAYTIGIWTSYLLHFYLTFNAFGFTGSLDFEAGLVMFVVGSIAVVVPTPNGAGPWHFAVITMMTFYGIDKTDASAFALIVHTLQSVLIIALGIYGLSALTFISKKPKQI